MKFRRKFYYKILNGEKVFCLELDKETLKNMVLDLQQRIDKAIKYINEITYCEFDNLYMEYGDDLTPEYIIKILKGEE